MTEAQIQKATFAGGCFWCMEHPFEKIAGVEDVVSGYANGSGENPAYQDYAQKGYVEVAQITFDSALVSYKQLLDVFWQQIDPTDAGGQFGDRGPQYRSAILYHSEAQKKEAEQSKKNIKQSHKFSKPLVTEIVSLTSFYKAEEYHQDYAEKHPIKYKLFRYNSGRDAFLKKTWGNDEVKPIIQQTQAQKPSGKELRARLTPLQYAVTQQDGTEKPFDNIYWNNDKTGIYVDVVSGEPLFSSLDKYYSGTGWPSFTQPLESENIIEKKQKQWFGSIIELRSMQADSHLGHLFTDGPAPTGLRYCINSAALKFIPVEDLHKKGFGHYVSLFKK